MASIKYQHKSLSRQVGSSAQYFKMIEIIHNLVKQMNLVLIDYEHITKIFWYLLSSWHNSDLV